MTKKSKKVDQTQVEEKVKSVKKIEHDKSNSTLQRLALKLADARSKRIQLLSA